VVAIKNSLLNHFTLHVYLEINAIPKTH